MKLRNKNHGGLGKVDYAQFGHIVIYPIDKDGYAIGGDKYVYNTLAALNKEWEDYTPKEPLIEDENIRKAVRAWFEANEISYKDVLRVRRTNSEVWSIVHEESYGREIIIEFFGNEPGDNILSEKPYYINELCGDDNETEE